MRLFSSLQNIKLGWLLAVFGLAIAAHAWHYVTSVLAEPDIPDLYARTWDFQLLVFSILRLPLWLAGLAVVMVLRRFGAASATR